MYSVRFVRTDIANLGKASDIGFSSGNPQRKRTRQLYINPVTGIVALFDARDRCGPGKRVAVKRNNDINDHSMRYIIADILALFLFFCHLKKMKY